MKRAFLYAFLLFCAVPLAACKSAAPDAPAEETPVPAETEAPAEEVTLLALDTPAPTGIPTPEPTPAPDSFSVVWIADTQFLSSLYPDTLSGMMRWTAENTAERNIRLLVHTGDIVNDFESARQWTDAGAAFALLSGKTPFLAVCGNHDVGTSTLTYTRFVKNVASLYPAGTPLYKEGRGVCRPLDALGQKLLFLGVGWGYNDSAVAWLNETLAAYPDYTAVLCLHSYMDPNGRLTDGGEIIWNDVIKKNRNVRLVLCGHRDGAAYLATEDGGRTVHQLLYNYQEERKNESGGFLRVLTFYPSIDMLNVSTYSPHLDAYLTDESASFTVQNVF